MSGKLITVFGATGQQGNSLAKALLAKKYKVRAVTRNPENAKAKELQGLGAEIAQVKNMRSREELEKAIQGSYGVFAVTNYWGLLAEYHDHVKAFDTEVAEGKAIADISKKAGVKHLVYSGLEYVKKIMGKDCPHFDSKGVIEEYLDEIGVPNTIARYAFYFDNFINFFPPKKNDDGTYTLSYASKKRMEGIAAADGGPAVASIFDSPEEYIGKKIGLAGEKLTGDEYAAILSKITGKTVNFNYIPPEVYAKLPFPGADDLAVMYEFFDFQDSSDRDIVIELTRKLNPATLNFEAWVEQNKNSLLRD